MKKFLIVITVLVLIFVVLILFAYFKCGSGGSFSCSSGNGCYCKYSFLLNNTSEKCPDCKGYCETKNKLAVKVFGVATGSVQVKSAKRLPDGTWDLKSGPKSCSCFCK